MIETWSEGIKNENMPEEALVSVVEEVRHHPWWPARASLALDLLAEAGVRPSATVLDIGSGWGLTLEALERAGYRVTGLDVSRRMLELIDRPGRRLIEADLNQAMPQGRGCYDAFLALDVIEHLEDDRSALRRMADLLRPGGSAIVSVPARPELFAEFDRLQGHRRRYLPGTLRAAFDRTGFIVKKIIWWGAWMVPMAHFTRSGASGKTYSDYLRLPPWPGPQLMKLAYAWERKRALQGKLRTGTSLFAVAGKQA